MFNILVFPCASGIGQEIFNSLNNKKNIKLIGINQNIKNAGYYLYDNYECLKYNMNDIEFIDELNNIIDKYNIDYIYPAFDDAIVYLKEKEDKLRCKNILTSSLNTVKICRSKGLTYENLNNKVNIPVIYNNIDNIEKYPVFIKPDIGSGSINCFKFDDYKSLKKYLDNTNDKYLIMEYLPNKEYTIDCLSDLSNNILYNNARERDIYKNGISVLTSNIVDEKINLETQNIAKIISKELKMQGAWFFQMKLDVNNNLKLLEVAPRIAGAMALSRYIGVNLPLLNLEIFLNNKIKINKLNLCVSNYKIYNNYIKSNIIFEDVYVDLDDTLIINNEINTNLISKIYKLKKNHKIFLISRHEFNIIDTLKKFYVDINLFNDIIHLKDRKIKKSSFLKKNDILIDDSFSERNDCNENNILAIDTDILEIL
jgi:carbamoylphosphate synthase large subunit